MANRETEKKSAKSKVPGTEGETPKVASSELVAVSEILPPHLLLIPVSQTTLFPGMIVPLVIPEGRLTKTLERAMEGQGYVGIVLYKSTAETVATGPTTSITGIPAEGTVPDEQAAGESKIKEFHRYGVAAKVLRKINLPDNQVSVLLTGLQRFELKGLASEEPFFVGNVKYLYEELDRTTELEALVRTALTQFKALSKDNPLISEEMKLALVNIDGPGKLADFIASIIVKDVADYQSILTANDVRRRLELLLMLLRREQDVHTVQRRMQDEINQKVTSAQREFYLQEQLKFIQKELGRSQDDRSKIADKYRERLKALHPPAEAKARIEEEFEKLSLLHEQSSEYSVAINYLDWATSLPWGVRSQEKYDLARAKRILDEDHFGLKDVKDRILEFLAVKKLKKSSEGTILCFVGPPGTGKTSLGKSIARVLDRKFFRFSVGGMRDEAEIKGHRRTYVGAMPGKMVQGLRRVGTQNPVFLIDEIDKMGNHFSTGGDPASALLELLDPEQNSEFLDHYLDIPFNCSEVFFIATANVTDTIPSALLDRMEIIPLRGYTDSEKIHIARKYLIPKQLKKNALKNSQLKFGKTGLQTIVTHYAREAGVRNLEKQITKVARKVALRVATGRTEPVTLNTPQELHRYLGNAPFHPEERTFSGMAGVATGLAWTQFGGEVLSIESTTVPGKGGILLTGSLGDVMKESANIAWTLVRGRSDELGLSPDYFDKHSFHLHVPSGATPKDGPSAGTTMTASLYSLLLGRALESEIAMTGEVTLTGRVLPVGGIKEKLLAAKRAGMKTVILPALNARELSEVEPEIRHGLKIVKVKTIEDLLKFLFPRRPKQYKRSPRQRS